MKTKTITGTLAALMFVLAMPIALTARADVESKAPFALVGTDIGTNYNYAVIPLFGNWQPRVQTWDTTSDKATAVLTMHTLGSPYTLTATNAAGVTNITVVNTSYAVATNGNEVVLYDPGNRVGYRATLDNAGSNFITVSPSLPAQLLPGAMLYVATAKTTFPVGTTNSRSATTVWLGEAGKPLLIDLDGTAACQINAVTGDYIKSD